MHDQTDAAGRQARILDEQVVRWRYEQLLRAAVPRDLADELSRDWRLDLHALIELVERGCPPELAVRILAPIDEPAHVTRAERHTRPATRESCQ